MKQGAMDRGGQIVQMAFLDKIHHPGSSLIDRQFINLHLPIQGVGDKNERHIRTFLMGHGERGKAIERRQTMIG